MKKIFVAFLYFIWIGSFIMLCSDCESALIFIISHLIASITFVMSTYLIQKYD